MGKILIIAEKPSLAKTVAAALKVTGRKDGYFENNCYIVTFAFGHLFALKNIDDYLGQQAKWADVPLPFIPEQYEFTLRPDEGAKKQYNIISELIKREDVTEIANCGDADREGQVIIDNIINMAFKDNAIKKKVSRLWLSEQTEATIQEAVRQMKPNTDYFNLFNEGLARTFFDWTIGINLTRLISVKANHKLPAGRVLIPIVRVIYDRDLVIRNFKPETYYQLESKIAVDEIEIPLTIRNKRYTANECSSVQAEADRLNQMTANVAEIEKKQVTKQPPKLFSLSKLQSKLSADEKMDFATSLSIIQTLYEKGFLTYPRTNTEYLAENEKSKVQAIIDSLDISGQLELKNSKGIFDDSKIESHSAITITTKHPDINALNEQEKKVYMTVYNRFISNFLKEPCLVDQVNVLISLDEHQFQLTGESVVQQGFLQYEKQSIKEQLPELQQGQPIPVDFKAVEKTTTAPKKITESSLSAYLKNPFYKDDEAVDREEDYTAILKGAEIGTEATRTGIITNAIKYEYISLKGQNYSIEPLGEKLIETLDALYIDLYKEKTVQFSIAQKAIYRGESTIDAELEKIHNELHKIVDGCKDIQIEAFKRPEKTPIGNCPRCGKPVFESEKGFYCQGFIIRESKEAPPKCEFFLRKDHKFFADRGKKITSTMAKTLLSKGKVNVKGLKPKDPGKQPYDAICIMEDTGKWINFKMEFNKK